MKKEIKIVNEKEGIVQVTTLDERWYAKPSSNKKSGLPEYIFRPSSSWVSSFYPKGIAFWKYLANKGWDEAELYKEQRGIEGIRTHKATELIDEGKKITMDTELLIPDTDKAEKITLQEYYNVMTYIDFFKNPKASVLTPKGNYKIIDFKKIELVLSEFNVFSDLIGGTVDRLFLIDGMPWIIDLKTSQNIWMNHILQLSSYKYALPFEKSVVKELKKLNKSMDDIRIATLQLGYRKNKRGFKFTEQHDKFNLFKHAYAIWEDENGNKSPKQRDFPLSLENKLPVAKPKKKPKKKVTKKKPKQSKIK